MNTLQDLLVQQIAELPRLIGLQVVSEKLRELGIYTEARAEKLLTHVLAGDEHVEWEDDDGPDIDVEISFGDADLARITALTDKFTAEFPDVLIASVQKIAPNMARRYRKDWKAFRPYEVAEFEAFKFRLEQRWGKGFDALRMLIASCHDYGEAFTARHHKSRAKRDRVQKDALIGLHIRGCQIAAEIICLMENGYADGAMARWRTLYELTVVAFLLAESGDALAERYFAHRAIEQYKAMNLYIENGPLLGERPLSKRDILAVTEAYEAAIATYGPTFKSEYGWATPATPGNPNPRFTHLEKAAGQAAMRSYYKFASYNVHAGPSGLAVRLSAGYGPHQIISGASNIGFLEPGQNTAYSLVQLTSTLLRPPFTADDLALMQTLIELRNVVPAPLVAAERKIAREERAKAKSPKKS